MISVEVIGRLGNQMFQYAFAVNSSKLLKTSFFIIPKDKFELNEFFKLDFFTGLFFNKSIIKYYRFLIKKLFLFDKREQVFEGKVKLDNNINYSGFFQSEEYFKEYASIILKRFKIKKKWRKLYKEKRGNVLSEKEKTIVMHFRRTDYINFGNEDLGGKNLCLPMSYYDNCLNKIHNINEYKILCISDDIESIKEYYKDKRNYSFLQNKAIIDFQFIKDADIAIIANSSFSWWAAYLNEKKNKIVYVPKYWFGFKINKEMPERIIPKDFLSINVY